MNIAIRVDASLGIGSGHVFRCLNIARELKLLGYNIIFFMRDDPHSLIDKVISEGFRVVRVPVENSGSRKSPFELHVVSDASFLVQSCSQLLIDWVVVDHYGADAAWENIVKSEFPILAIDDFCAREHVAQIVLNPNFLSSDHIKTLMENSGTSRTISGVDFIPLRSRSRFPAESHQPHSNNGGLSIYFGASDPFGLTVRMLKILLEDLGFRNTIHVIIGINSTQTEEIAVFAQTHHNVRVHEFTEDLGSIFSIAQYSIGAGGSALWERLLYRNNCLVIGIADNQTDLSECLHEEGHIKFSGFDPNITNEKLLELTQEFLAGWVPQHLGSSSLALDRLGSARIASLIAITGGDSDSFRLEPQDLELENSSSSRTYDLYWRNLYVSSVEIHTKASNTRFSIKRTGFLDAIESAAQIQLSSLVQRMLQVYNPGHYLGSQTKQKFKVLFLLSESSWIDSAIWGHLGTLLSDEIFIRVAYDIPFHEEADICLLLGFDQLLEASQLSQFKNVLVVHESDLPQGRGWSPMTWGVLLGHKEMHLTLLEAEPDVDSGVIYGKSEILLTGSELLPELRDIQLRESFNLIGQFLRNYPATLDASEEQVGEPTYFKRRTKADSQCESSSTIDSVFDLLRVSDPERYPVYFEKNGSVFKLSMVRIESSPIVKPPKGSE